MTFSLDYFRAGGAEHGSVLNRQVLHLDCGDVYVRVHGRAVPNQVQAQPVCLLLDAGEGGLHHGATDTSIGKHLFLLTSLSNSRED